DCLRRQGVETEGPLPDRVLSFELTYIMRHGDSDDEREAAWEIERSCQNRHLALVRQAYYDARREDFALVESALTSGVAECLGLKGVSMGPAASLAEIGQKVDS